LTEWDSFVIFDPSNEQTPNVLYRRIIQPILFSMNIERAHRTVMLLLRITGALPGGRWLLRKLYATEHPALEREVFGLRFPNPVGLAAGFDRNGEAFRELAALGFGFIEIGTVTPRPQSGNPRPRVFRLPRDKAIVNRMGLCNRGLEKTISMLRKPHEGILVGCNIGKNTVTPPENAPADYLKVFRNLYEYADYFTVNISCETGNRECSAHTRENITRILAPLFDFRRGQNQYRPILLKISPDLPDEAVDAVTDTMISTPLDGIVATNGTYSREGLRTSRTTIGKIGNGRLSGQPLTRRAVEVVRRIRERSGGAYPIIGVGGLMSPDDVRAMLDAGASLVQLYTGYIYEGPRLLRKICRRLIADASPPAASADLSPAAPTDLPSAPATPAASPKMPQTPQAASATETAETEGRGSASTAPEPSEK
jgi:dihydroorotate oxidase